MKKSYISFIFGLALLISNAQTINEFYPDTPGADTIEFIEIKWHPNTSLMGYIVVLYNGNNDLSYDTINLSNVSTDANGLFVINFSSSGIQNGSDGIALYKDSPSNFPNGTAATTTNLLDAVVYGTNDADDLDLLTALGETRQYNIESTATSLNQSDTGTFYLSSPTEGLTNNILSNQEKHVEHVIMYPIPTHLGYLNISNSTNSKMDISIFDLQGKHVLRKTIHNKKLDLSNLNPGVYLIKVSQNNTISTRKLIIQ